MSKRRRKADTKKIVSRFINPDQSVILILLIFLLAAGGCRRKTVYQYNLDDLMKVPADAICYREQAVIPLAVEEARGLAVAAGNVFVTGDDRLFIFAAGGRQLKQFGLDYPAACLAVSAGERLYLGMTDHVEVYAPAGDRLQIWAALGEKAVITSLALSGGQVYAADAGNHVVICYTADGKMVRRIGEPGPGQTAAAFIIPSLYFDVAPGPDKGVWIVNPGRHRLEQYSNRGAAVSAWGEGGFDLAGFAGCCNPVHIALLPDGSFITAEKGLARVKLYNPLGEFQCVVAAPGRFREGNVIADLAAGEQGLVYILESAPPAVHIYSRDGRGNDS